MRILIIAYEFPPSPSPQSLRWAYLGRELARAGHDVHVLTTDLGRPLLGLPPLLEAMKVHRVVGGPISGVLAMLARRQEAKAAKKATRTESNSRKASGERATVVAGADIAVAASVEPEVVAAIRESRLNWKGRLVERLKLIATRAIFPDERGEWFYPARKAALRIAQDIQPDLIVTSHEPATTAELGLMLKRRLGMPWIADLGDPILADYTPQCWRRRALKLEGLVLATADGVTVTSEGTRELLLERHGNSCGRSPVVEVLTQGFDDSGMTLAPPPRGFFDPERLELLYTGTFYRFRRPEALIDAVAMVPGVRLNIATSVIPDWLMHRLGDDEERLRLLGFLPHARALAMQRSADVLVNIANDNTYQVPGKVYEYLGSGRPILHLGNGGEGDAAAALVSSKRRGWVCDSAPELISDLLRRLFESKHSGTEFPGVILDQRDVADFGWSALAHSFAGMAAKHVPMRHHE